LPGDETVSLSQYFHVGGGPLGNLKVSAGAVADATGTGLADGVLLSSMLAAALATTTRTRWAPPGLIGSIREGGDGVMAVDMLKSAYKTTDISEVRRAVAAAHAGTTGIHTFLTIAHVL
jgi:hypothetical protein